ncbi:hypothetical protein [Xylophilus sp. GOD-11R]|uniref:hypothetical protein n=1 Tax=Xylophilus sp. GOD-11R TaxID=3089814 RepID=UPI00298C0025|nr:hypothetical protein [Xylophilus sp. GOD-11R]WPB55045.1 hypothetical protein R9X41_12790 [Xylophilus sp. GOD-11R]
MPEPARRVPYRSWPGALGVLAAIGLYVGGLMLWDRSLPAGSALASGQTVEVGPVRFLPVNDWWMDLSRTRAGQSLVLFRGRHRFVVSVGPWTGGPEGPARRQRRLMERGQGLRIDGDASGFFNGWGLQGDTFAYYGARVAGRFWQVVDVRRRLLLQVDCYGPNEDLDDVLQDAREMVESMDLDARS